MKTAVYIAGLATVLFASSTVAQAPICASSDGDSIKAWMQACEAVVGDSAAKCADKACHTALHRLEEEETHECWEFLGLGSHHDFDKYVALDAFCHGEGPDPSVTPAPGAPICTDADGMSILLWMNDCDSVTGNSSSKCADKACHSALHHLEEEETAECWEFLGFGVHEDLRKYVMLDAFCHGEGADPDAPEAAIAAANSTIV